MIVCILKFPNLNYIQFEVFISAIHDILPSSSIPSMTPSLPERILKLHQLNPDVGEYLEAILVVDVRPLPCINIIPLKY